MKYYQEYSLFRMKSTFEVEPLEKEGDNIYFRGELVQDAESKYSEGSTFLNIAYSFKNSAGRVLSSDETIFLSITTCPLGIPVEREKKSPFVPATVYISLLFKYS